MNMVNNAPLYYNVIGERSLVMCKQLHPRCVVLLNLKRSYKFKYQFNDIHVVYLGCFSFGKTFKSNISDIRVHGVLNLILICI